MGSVDAIRSAKRVGRALSLVVASVCTAASALATPTPVQAQSDDAAVSNEVLFLLLPVGARGVGLGRAMTAFSTAEAAFWNPAGLAGTHERQLFVFRGTTLAGEQTAASFAFGSPGVGSAAISYHLLDVGEAPFTNPDGQVVGSGTVRSHQAIATLATQFGAKVDAGLNFRLIHYRQSCRGQCTDSGLSATSYSLDFGAQFAPSDTQPLRFGAMIAHAGPDLQFLNAEQADPLPTRLRLSAAYDVLAFVVDESPVSLWASFEIEDRLRALGNRTYYLGGELRVGGSETLYVRAGYGYEELEELRQTEGGAVGVGLEYDRFDLGIARSVGGRALGPESEPIYFTLGLTF